MKPVLSIIVPVYNVEKYLGTCIQSILDQSYSDFELVLVDDGSSDDSGEICDSYVNLDARVSVYHTENKGVSCARNYGLDYAKGEFVMFVDSDDELPQNAIDQLLKNHADFVVGGVIRRICGKEQYYKYRESKDYLYDKNAFFDDSFSVSVLLDGPSAKVYKTDIINRNNLRFKENINYGEDKLFVYEYLLHANTIIAISDFVYIQKRREGSLSSDISSQHHLKQIIAFLSCYHILVREYQKAFSCHAVKTMYHNDVIRRYVFRYLTIVRTIKTRFVSLHDIRFISFLLRKDKIRIGNTERLYIRICKWISSCLPPSFLYSFIYLLNTLR